MNAINLIWKEQLRVPTHAVDMNGKMKFSEICYSLFDIAAAHARHLNWGYDDMQSRKTYWVLSRLHVKILKYPLMYETISVETWPKGVSRLFAIRDYSISNESGETVALATTAWIIVDAGTGKPRRPDDLVKDLNLDNPKHGIEEVPDKLPSVVDPELTVSYKVRYTDLDINKHVNSGKYIEWIQDCFKGEKYDRQSIKEFQINFQSETRLDETINLKMFTEAGNTDINFFEGSRESDGTVAIRARLVWGKCL